MGDPIYTPDPRRPDRKVKVGEVFRDIDAPGIRLDYLSSRIKEPFLDMLELEPDEAIVLNTLARGGPVAMLAARLYVNPRTVYRIARRGLRKLSRWLPLPGDKQYRIEDLTALAFQILEWATNQAKQEDKGE